MVQIVKKGDYYARMSQILGYTEREHVYAPGMEHVFIVDEMGLLKGDANERGFFQPSFFYQPICGNALLLGLTKPEGDLTDCSMPLELVKQSVKFPKVRFTGFTDTTEEQDHPWLPGQKITAFVRRANFEPIDPQSTGRTQ